jgi:hypothetical protein
VTPGELARACERGEQILDAMRRLRFGDWHYPPADADPPAVHEALVDMRRRLDLADPLLEEMTRLRDETKILAGRLKAEADDAFDAELTRLAGTAARREYESGADRQASARVKALEARREARGAERGADLVNSHDRRVRALFYGMRDTREDLLTRLGRYLPWLSSLET